MFDGKFLYSTSIYFIKLLEDSQILYHSNGIFFQNNGYNIYNKYMLNFNLPGLPGEDYRHVTSQWQNLSQKIEYT